MTAADDSKVCSLENAIYETDTVVLVLISYPIGKQGSVCQETSEYSYLLDVLLRPLEEMEAWLLVKYKNVQAEVWFGLVTILQHKYLLGVSRQRQHLCKQLG